MPVDHSLFDELTFTKNLLAVLVLRAGGSVTITEAEVEALTDRSLMQREEPTERSITLKLTDPA